jgi:hypothetical protein
MAGAYDILRTRFYSQPPDAQLLVTPRRRAVGNAIIAVGAARASADIGLPQFQAGDVIKSTSGLLIEEWGVAFDSNDNTGATQLTNLILNLKLVVAGTIQPVDTVPSQLATAVFGPPFPPLLIKQQAGFFYSSMDLQAIFFNTAGTPQFVPEASQPLQFRIGVALISTVAGSSVNARAYVLYRVVSGFQEG